MFLSRKRQETAVKFGVLFSGSSIIKHIGSVAYSNIRALCVGPSSTFTVGDIDKFVCCVSDSSSAGGPKLVVGGVTLAHCRRPMSAVAITKGSDLTIRRHIKASSIMARGGTSSVRSISVEGGIPTHVGPHRVGRGGTTSRSRSSHPREVGHEGWLSFINVEHFTYRCLCISTSNYCSGCMIRLRSDNEIHTCFPLGRRLDTAR